MTAQTSHARREQFPLEESPATTPTITPDDFGLFHQDSTAAFLDRHLAGCRVGRIRYVRRQVTKKHAHNENVAEREEDIVNAHDISDHDSDTSILQISATQRFHWTIMLLAYLFLVPLLSTTVMTLVHQFLKYLHLFTGRSVQRSYMLKLGRWRYLCEHYLTYLVFAVKVFDLILDSIAIRGLRPKNSFGQAILWLLYKITSPCEYIDSSITLRTSIVHINCHRHASNTQQDTVTTDSSPNQGSVQTSSEDPNVMPSYFIPNKDRIFPPDLYSLPFPSDPSLDSSSESESLTPKLDPISRGVAIEDETPVWWSN